MFYVVSKRCVVEFDNSALAMNEARETGGCLVWFGKNNEWNELDYSR